MARRARLLRNSTEWLPQDEPTADEALPRAYQATQVTYVVRETTWAHVTSRLIESLQTNTRRESLGVRCVTDRESRERCT